MSRPSVRGAIFIGVAAVVALAGTVTLVVRRLADAPFDGALAVTETSAGQVVIGNGTALFTVTRHGNVGVKVRHGDRWRSLQLPHDPPGRVGWDGGDLEADAILTDMDPDPRANGPGWPGRTIRLQGSAAQGGRRWSRWMDVHLGMHPRTLLAVRLGYRNDGARGMRLDSVTTLQTSLAAKRAGRGAARGAALWSFHGVSEHNGQSAVVPVLPGLERPNVMGVMDDSGRGGGLPIVAAWSRDVGFALGHLDPDGAPISLPMRRVAGPETLVETHVPGAALAPGQTYETPWLFVAAFEGDYYDALRLYSDALRLRGWRPAEPSPAAYEPTWCGWGFGRGVRPDDMIGVLPALKRLDLTWATVDEGWFQAMGDWTPRRRTYGSDGIERVVAAYRGAGVRAQLWWLPIGAEAGEIAPGLPRRMARVVREHPEWLVRDARGRPIPIVHGLAALCPALPQVRAYHRELVRRFLADWGFDGLKLDYVFTVPECHDPRHGHASPRDSVNAVGRLLREIREEAKAIRPDCVIQICPCGTLPNIAWLAYEDQPVTSDPTDGPQVRRRIKIYKALLGDRTPVYGDHVELTRVSYDGGRQVASGSDFASTIGPGGVPGTRFVWPTPRPRDPQLLLTPTREQHWKRWLAHYRSKRLAEGVFRNLYVHGFDWPEAYAIARDDRMFYAFFAAESSPTWEGTLELRGLDARRYRVEDYVNGRDLGIVSGPVGVLKTRFEEHLLIEVRPDDSPS